MSKVKKTFYRIERSEFGKKLRFALVSDLHGEDPQDVIQILKEERPDHILCPGDIFERLDGSREAINENGFRLFEVIGTLAPTFFSVGNHENGGVRSWNPGWKNRSLEKYYRPEDVERIKRAGVRFLDDGYVIEDGIAFGGFTSGLINEGNIPHTKWLEEFDGLDIPRVLLCHHPEYYKKYLSESKADLIVSGHAHGGQWRVFGRGVFAPGQGIFPKYTAGVHDGRFVISRGLKSGGKIPRIFNPREVVFIDVN